MFLAARRGVALIVITVVVTVIAVALLADSAVLLANDVQRAGAVLRGRIGPGTFIVRGVLLGRRVLGAAVLGVCLLLAGPVLQPLPELTGARLAVGVLLLGAVLALGVLNATELLAGVISLACAFSLACAVICAGPVLGLLRRLTVLADAELPGTGFADSGLASYRLAGSAVLLADPELAGRVAVGRARLPWLPELVVGRLLAGAVAALTGLLDGGELSRPVLRLLPLLRAGLLLRSPVLTCPCTGDRRAGGPRCSARRCRCPDRRRTGRG